MPNGIQISDQTMKSIASLRLTILSENLVLNTPSPSSFVLDEGIEQKTQTRKSSTGETVPSGSFVISRRPTLSIGFMHLQRELMAISMGYRLEAKDYSAQFPLDLWVTQAEYAPKAPGKHGYGTPKDINLGLNNAPRGSVKRSQISVPLAQAPWDQYSVWRSQPRRFAIGANMALRFSDDVVASNDVVALSIPTTGVMTVLSDANIGPIRIDTLVIDTLDQVHLVEVYSANNDLSGSKLEPGADNMEMKFFVNTPPGYCRGWNMMTPQENNAVACAAA